MSTTRNLLAAIIFLTASPSFAACLVSLQTGAGTIVACPPSVPAIPNNTFLNSLGVNTHMGQGYSESAYEPQFLYTGIRNARDYAAQFSEYLTLHTNTISGLFPGVKMDVFEGGVTNTSDLVTWATTLANAGALVSMEGPNEPNNQQETYNGQLGGGSGTWLPIALYMADQYNAIVASPVLKNYPFFGVSENGAVTDNVGIQCLALNPTCPGAALVTLMPQGTVFATHSNNHNYTSGDKPPCTTPAPNQAWNTEDPQLNSCWDGVYGDNVVTWNHGFTGYTVAQAYTLPRVTTETGWNSDPPSTQDYQGKVLVNTYLDAYKRGWAYTFIYEMVDQQGSSSNQGLYTTGNVAKLSATYIHNMTTVLADNVNFVPGNLSYWISAEPSTVHDMLLQNSNGTFNLVVWDEQVASTTTDSITVNLGAASTVLIYDTTVGTSPVSTFTNVMSVPLTLSDHAVILQITPTPPNVTATANNTFLSTLGVNTHMGQGFAEAAYEPEFTYTGIRNARDYAAQYAEYLTLHTNTISSSYPGVKMDVFEGAVTTTADLITWAVPLANAGALVSMEGPNEPNNQPIVYNGQTGGGTGGGSTWLPVAKYMSDQYVAIKANTTLQNYPFFGVSEIGAETDNVGLQCSALNSSCAGAAAVTLMPANSVFQTHVNPHNYVQGNGSCGTPAVNQAWNAEDPILNSCWDSTYGDDIVTWNKGFAGYSVAQMPAVPRVTSETGWNSDSPSLDYQGKVLVNTYLDGYKRGWAYTFIYEMVDQQGSSSNQGLYTSATPGVAKLSATYIHNLTTILADTTNFTPGGLSYSIANEPATVHDMLLENSNGNFYLVIWDEETTTSTTDNIVVSLGAVATVTEYDVTSGTSPVNTFTNAITVPLALSDHAVILMIP